MIGAGSFGSAMANRISQSLASQNPSSTLSWYARRQSVVDEINMQRTNKQYFPSVGPFHKNITASNNILECVDGAKVVFLAMPTAYLSPILEQLRDEKALDDDAVLVSLAKSLKYDKETRTIKSVVNEVRTALPDHATIVLSGPNIYSEMASFDEFAEATIGYDAGGMEEARLVQQVTSSRFFQCTLCSDRVGIELCGGLKNVISLATGYCEGLGLGWNAKAAVIRAGQHEIAHFMKKFDMGEPDTVFKSSAGVGDLILTCSAGRGRTLAASFVQDLLENPSSDDIGANIKRWETLENKTLNGMKLPDWHNAQQVYCALTDHGIVSDFPLFEAVYNIGFTGQHPSTIIDALSSSIRLADEKEDLCA
eukprot:CAMPEP_0195515280 /NCGR_PEP_ID=MMETSP0794_2-20130614/6403_1 /TAXON_ID=515487 /ORGANISM="Stephanopyxis turris, Strain CCMP 815" /LENGTH=365 /DNA_ID=CAMNT_0040643679 /DNA_START=289 /DNA_END=1386 /DNA_ORIENTATION=-